MLSARLAAGLVVIYPPDDTRTGDDWPGHEKLSKNANEHIFLVRLAKWSGRRARKFYGFLTFTVENEEFSEFLIFPRVSNVCSSVEMMLF